MKSIFLKDIINIISGKLKSRWTDSKILINKVYCDSRKIPTIEGENSLFFALKGENQDGNLFVKEALEKGALFAVVAYKPKDVLDNSKLIYVKNTLNALGKLAKYYKSFFNIPFIGITGSIGKTLTKEFLANILKQKFCVHKSQGNLNTVVGLPLSIFQLMENHEISVMELGTNHFGEIRFLTKILQPSIAVITNIAESHIEFLENIKGVFKEKTDIFKYSPPKTLKIFNGDISLFDRYKGKDNYISFGENKDNDYIINSIQMENLNYAFKLDNEKYFIYNNFQPNIFNVAPAIIIGLRYGLTHEQIQNGLICSPEVSLRMQIFHNKAMNWLIIADCYNANPQSMKASLYYLKKQDFPHKVAILGDMLELGKRSQELHVNIGKIIKRLGIDKVISVGRLSKYYHGEYHFSNINKLYNQNEILHFPKNSIILLKGSRAIRIEKILERLLD